ncbi:hypothetical protein ACJMK2_036316 [Sinanodonta woodiana]|uniref:Uncharacterized protein n=1 Tax=Sinanodonta woodiana TaxID=1069815 RepID=A0ABD3WIY6_SINWO
MLVILCLLFVVHIVGVHMQTTAESKSNDCPRFDYDYKLLERLVRIECAQREVESTLAALREKFQTIQADVLRILDDIRRLMDNKSKDPWKLVFRVTAGGGTNPYYAWQNGTGTLDSDNCMMLYPSSCTKYYRNKLLDSWTNWPIEKVKFALYKNHTQVAYIVFDGTGSDMESWFSKQRVVASSWSDIIESNQMLYFSIQGDSLRGRYFFIHEAYGGCNVDVGWTVAAFGIQVSCSIDSHASYPGLVYAKNGTKALYSSQGYGVADVLAVYVKLQEE